MRRNVKILIVGHDDIIENSLLSYFTNHGFKNVFSSSANRLDVLNQNKVNKFFEQKGPDYIFLGSARSGGIAANKKFAAEFIYSNLESQNNLIQAAYKFGVKKILYFSSSCIYPKEAKQPLKEEYLLTGPLEPTSEPYAIAKIAGAKLCQTYKDKYNVNAIVAVPATVYGPGSDLDIETAHVIGALIGKFHKAIANDEKEVVVWGTGKPQREFLYVDDFVESCLFLMENYNEPEIINIGCGYDVSVKELAEMVEKVSGFKGKIVFDSSQPDGVMKKLLDNSRIKKLGWKPKVDLEEGITRTYQWYAKHRKWS